jgi:elongation factor 1-gamma
MAPIGTLWTVPGQPTGRVIRATAAFAGLDIEIPAAYEHYVDNKKPEFLSKFPHGKIPAFEGANGFKLFEGVAIARYVASLAPNSGLLGTSSKEAALIDQWIHLADSEVDEFTTNIIILCLSIIPYNKATHTLFTERLARALNTLDKHLSTHTFFVGERITLADIFIAAILKKATAYTFDAAARAANPNLVRHLETVANQPKLKEIFGEITYIDKAIQFTPPAKDKKEKAPAPPPAPTAEK